MTGSGAVAPVVARAGPEDVDKVMRLMDAAFDPRFGEAWTAAQLRTLFAVPGTQLCLIATQAAYVGFYAARLAGPESELLLLAVDPAQRRSGFGKILVAHWLDWAGNAGAADYFLEMRADNPARHLYEQSGFVECGRRPGYYQGRDGITRDALTMRHTRP